MDKIVIDKIKFPVYGVIILFSLIIGMLYVYKSLIKEGYKDKNIKLYFLLYFVFAIMIGKIYTVMTTKKLDIISAGLSSYGGMIGVILSAFIFEKILPLNKQLIKYTILSLPIVYGLSKIACFISGCCYGIPYNFIFSVTYTAGLNTPLFPIQLVEAIIFIIIFLVCNKFRYNKNIIFIVIVMSALAKFLLDFFRYDHLKVLITKNQIFSIVIILLTIIFFFYKKSMLKKSL